MAFKTKAALQISYSPCHNLVMTTSIKKSIVTHHASLLSMLCCLTLLFISTQIMLFITHYHVGELIDSLVESSLNHILFNPSILLPIVGFILIQIISYVLFVAYIWFIATATGELFHFSSFKTYCLGLFLWVMGCLAILMLNQLLYPHSFFAELLSSTFLFQQTGNIIFLVASTAILLFATVLAYAHFFWHKRHRLLGSLFLFLALMIAGLSLYDQKQERLIIKNTTTNSLPNVIIIGLDSLRPDFIHHFSKRPINTSHIDTFLKNAVVFTDAYTPLARTFPSWISILTAKYPKHSNARNNLPDPKLIAHNDTLAKRLKQSGYETIYATDEKRFSNITKQYGFDHIIGPSMGINDFILGGLSDFPLSNLLINLPGGQFLFPYNFANRAAAITYEPNQFLHLIKSQLNQRTNKPLFLAVHFCISHWPFFWSHTNVSSEAPLLEQYTNSVEAVNDQLGKLMTILRSNGLLDHSLVVLLSDHGTTLGLPNDRLVTEKNYQGKTDSLKWLPRFPRSKTDEHGSTRWAINTSYGQGTDILSLKQYHTLLAVKGFGIPTEAKHIHRRYSLLDIAPSILEFLKLPPLNRTDGISFKSELLRCTSCADLKPISRPLFFETGYTIADIETKNINVNHVIKNSIIGYEVNPKNQLLYLTPLAEKGMIQDKQYAVMLGDWLLARYPSSQRLHVEPDHPSSKTWTLKMHRLMAYFVLVNLKTGKWTINFDEPLAKSAPTTELLDQLRREHAKEWT